MNRLDRKLAGMRPLLACYLPVGDPMVPPATIDIYATCGVDIVELGMPSPAPFMDGPDVASSMARSLGAGDPYAALAALGARARSLADGPAAICMCYADLDVAAALAVDAFASIDGLLMLGLDGRPDSTALRKMLRDGDVREIRLVGDDLRPEQLAASVSCDGYLMLQAAGGVTGPRSALDPANRSKITRLRSVALRHKILLGFGIGAAEQAAEAVSFGADGVVIGSMCVRKAIEGPEQLRDFLTGVRSALDG